jgi:hypothetical protein
MRLMTPTRVLPALLFTALLFGRTGAYAESPGPATSAGPGKIICKTATSCQLGIGDPAQIKYQINVDALPAPDKERLGKQCTSTGKTPCVATVTGTEMGDLLKVKAAKITWYN